MIQLLADDPRIVMIEDDGEITDMYRIQLEADGHTVWTAKDGEAGVAMTREVVPDIVFLDLQLPKLDGFEVLIALRKDPKTAQVPVVILSNYGAPEMVQRGLDLGAREYLVKARATPVEVSSRLSTWVS